MRHLKNTAGQIIPIPLDEKLMSDYENSGRFSVTFPADVLEQLDSLGKIRGLNRSAILIRAAEEYMKNHGAVSGTVSLTDPRTIAGT